ncbi:unnamed protein product [Cuscuta epithymum]|uniref:Uncharacterized protein n=1 Tax=Cuscuta epithymum TaxID=186058 RepID=A0AAV0C269_9ASTE|nr:unnamed protein product [Cuscuta epithymum]
MKMVILRSLMCPILPVFSPWINLCREGVVDTLTQQDPSLGSCLKSSGEVSGHGKKEALQKIKVVELEMQRWAGQRSRPFLFGILSDGTILCYLAYIFEGSENYSPSSINPSNSSGTSRLRNLRLVRVPLENYAREEVSSVKRSQRIIFFLRMLVVKRI